MERKVIFKSVTGSRLYGTERPESDEDYTGVFLPSTLDLLGLQKCPGEWSMSTKVSTGPRNGPLDKDYKLYSLAKFANLALEGQPGQLELLFVPDSAIKEASDEWWWLRSYRESFLSKKAVAPFVGFARSQMNKAQMKGQTLTLISEVIDYCHALFGQDIPSGLVLGEVLERYIPGPGEEFFKIDWEQERYLLPIKVNLQGFRTVEIGGREYDVNLQLKRFVQNLKELEKRYGSRSRQAAEQGYDWKSLVHAYRLSFEAIEFLATGSITFPIAGNQPGIGDKLEFLRKVREGKSDADHEVVLDGLLEEIRDAEKSSTLPEEPDYKKVQEQVMYLQQKYLGVK